MTSDARAAVRREVVTQFIMRHGKPSTRHLSDGTPMEYRSLVLSENVFEQLAARLGFTRDEVVNAFSELHCWRLGTWWLDGPIARDPGEFEIAVTSKGGA
ncbi:MAG: hypothetical protein EPO21_24710 [Chloroflexota bacterium]|nr:MAG: hypothetical protein EPO21_24710 [Chloroflexota bacterium]